MAKTFAKTANVSASTPRQDHDGRTEHGVDVEGRRADLAGSRVEPREEPRAEEDEEEPRPEVEPPGRVHQEEAEVPPAVPPGAQVRRPRPAVLAERDRDLADAKAEEGRLDDHLARELHPGRPEADAVDRLLPEAADAAVEVRDRDAEEEASEEGEDGVPEPAVKKRHGARLDPALEARAHDEVVPFLEPGHEGGDLAEVVGVVCVAHDDVTPPRRGDSAEERGTVAPLGDGDDPRAGALGDLLRAVGRAVVGHDHLAREPGGAERLDGAPHAAFERLGFVQARHQDRDEEGRRVHAGIVARVRPEPGVVRSSWP